jgi:DNA (cytosine-5)-methyltransferase 1
MNLSDSVANPLLANDYKEPQAVCMATQQGGAEIRTDDKAPTLTAAAGMSGNNQPVYADAEYTVRRLTPLECERLQGFPDGWTDIGEWTDSKGKKHKDSDSPRYKALGNSIALPFWTWLLDRLNKYCAEHTMASLFDGIGGFPLIWETLNGSGSCRWASEIEEFPIAVTKYHFGEENT